MNAGGLACLKALDAARAERDQVALAATQATRPDLIERARAEGRLSVQDEKYLRESAQKGAAERSAA
jgi:hypothetical protein